MIKAAIFDWGYTIHDHVKDVIYPDALTLIKELKAKGIILILISRAPDIQERFKEFKKFNLENYFQIMEVVPRETEKEFSKVLINAGVKPFETLVIGDRVKSEILQGNKIGCVTVWIRQGKFAGEFATNKDEEPDYTIKKFGEISPILKKLVPAAS